MATTCTGYWPFSVNIAGTFGDSGVSIRSVWQEGRGDRATLLLVTHSGPEAAHRKALDQLGGMGAVRQVAAVMRVVGDPA